MFSVKSDNGKAVMMVCQIIIVVIVLINTVVADGEYHCLWCLYSWNHKQKISVN